MEISNPTSNKFKVIINELCKEKEALLPEKKDVKTQQKLARDEKLRFKSELLRSTLPTIRLQQSEEWLFKLKNNNEFLTYEKYPKLNSFSDWYSIQCITRFVDFSFPKNPSRNRVKVHKSSLLRISFILCFLV